MSEAAAAPAAPAAPAPAPAAPAQRSTAEDRAQDMIARFQSEDPSPSEPAADEAGEQPSTPQDGPSPTAADSGGAALPQATQDRLARIARVRAAHDVERQKRAQEQQRRQQQQQASSEVETLRKRLADLEPLANIPKSEEALLSWAESQGMSSEKLVQYMRQRLTDPAAIAKQQAKTEADQLREEMRRQREEFEAWKRSTEEKEQERVAQYHAERKAHEFLQRSHASKESHPLTAQMLAKFGPQGLVAYANQFVAPLLPADYDIEQLHDHVEQLLFETQLGSPAASPQVQPANPPSAKNGAGQPVTTLGNAVAAERASVREEIPLHKMPLDERAEYLKAKLMREQ
jgi:hypothetical protein